MKYISLLIISLLVISCALEKEETDIMKAKFTFTIASVQIDNISNMTMNSNKKLCIPASTSYDFNYSATSNGFYGDDTQSIIRNSYIESLSTKLYFYYDCTNSTNCSNISIDISNLPNLPYNQTVSGSSSINPADYGIVEGKEYLVSILVYGRERNGDGYHTLDNQFSSDFGTVIFSNNCQNTN